MDDIHAFTKIILDKMEQRRSFAESQAKDNALRSILAPEEQQGHAREEALRLANEERIWREAIATVKYVYDHKEMLMLEKKGGA